jgi:glycosyltransferase involved in cell wall biosynthesis
MVDVIIPAYNAHDTLEKCLLSIANQTIADKLQVIIVDDKSPNGGYKDIISKFSHLLKIKEIPMEINGGPGLARKAGVDNSNNPYMTFIDADDVFLDAMFLEGSLQLLEQTHECVMISAGFLEVNDKRQFHPHIEDMVWMFGKVYRREFWQRNQINFSHLRSNEDLEVNTKIRLSLSLDRTNGKQEYIYFIKDKMVYLWSFKEGSITRADNFQYSYNDGLVGALQAKIYAYNHITSNKERAKQEMLTQVPELYNQYNSIVNDRPDRKDYLDNVWKIFVEFWNTMAKVEWDKLNDIDKAFLFNQSQAHKREKHIIPKITFNEFIEMLNKGTYEKDIY